MRALQTSILFLLGLSLSLVSNAQAIKKTTLDELLVTSGAISQITDMGVAAAAVVNSSSPDFKTQSQIAAVIDAVFDPMRITEALETTASSSLEETDGQALLQFYNSELGKRIAKAEEYASSPEGLQAYDAIGGPATDSEERTKAISGLVEASGLLDQNATLDAVFNLMTYSLLTPEQREAMGLDLAVIKAGASAERQRVSDQESQEIISRVIFTLKDFSLKEIKAYQDVLETDAMKKFNLSQDNGFALHIDKILDDIILLKTLVKEDVKPSS